jgi:glutathione synthase/RimK-type ligase-like ATP-grasp enzyme
MRTATSPLASDPSGGVRFTVVGNPGNRRIALFAAAVRAAGLPPPRVLPWLDVACGRVAVEAGALVRIDSPGEDGEVDRRFRGAAEPIEHGRIESFAGWYRGFRAALARLGDELAGTPGVDVLNRPDDLAVMFDKPRCARRLAAAGVPVPPALGPFADWEELRAALAAAGWSRAFVKPAHGSSASGVVALAIAGGRVRATTSVELVRCGRGVRLYNSLRVRTYDDERDVTAIVDAICADGVHVERWLPKAGLDGRVIDLRVVVIAGRPTHAVVRASRSPLTNLHLGNRRGDVTRLRAAMGEQTWVLAMATCVRAAACFPRTLQVAVDLLLAPSWRRHAVAEVNAFGDLLPGVLASGRDTYAEQVDAVLCGRHLAWARDAGSLARRAEHHDAVRQEVVPCTT